MPVEPPSPAAIAKVAERYGLRLSGADVASFSPIVAGLLTSWDVVEELYGQTAPAAQIGRASCRERV